MAASYIDNEDEMICPLRLRPLQDHILRSSRVLQTIRSHLDSTSLPCKQHAHLSSQTRETYLLPRDLLHALTAPITRLYEHATSLSRAVHATPCSEVDLERAFTGDARSAYVWLQCFLSDEISWHHSTSCATCFVQNAMFSDSAVRFVFAACSLASHEHDLALGERFPRLDFMADVFSAALKKDPFWGPTHWHYLVAKAEVLEVGFRELIFQCQDLRVLVSTPSGSPLSGSHVAWKTDEGVGDAMPVYEEEGQEVEEENEEVLRNYRELVETTMRGRAPLTLRLPTAVSSNAAS